MQPASSLKPQIANLRHFLAVIAFLSLTLTFFSPALFAANPDNEDEDEPDYPKTRAELRITPLSPEIEDALAGFVTKAVVPKTEQLTEHMTRVIEAVDNTTPLSKAEKTALDAAAAAAIADVIETWRQRFHEDMRPYLTNENDSSIIARLTAWKPDDIAKANLVEGCVLPDALPVWDKALETILGTERFSRWNKIAVRKRRELHERIDTYVATWAENERKPLDVLMQKQVDDLHKALNLPDQQRERLAEAATNVVDDFVAGKIERVAEMFRFLTTDLIEKRLAQENANIRFDMPKPLSMSDPWLEAIDTILEPEDVAHWKKHLAQKRAEREKALVELLEPSLEHQRIELETMMETEVSDLVLLLDLPKKRQDELNILSEKAIDASGEASVKGWLKSLRGIRDEDFEEMQQQGGAHYGTDEALYPTKLDVWKSGLERILTEDERNHVKREEEARESREVAAFGKITLAELDGKIAFTAAQREKLEPLLIGSAQALPSRHSTGRYWSFSINTLFEAARSVDEKEIRDILDDAQWARWEKVCLGRTGQDASGSLDDASEKAAQQEEREEIEPLVKPELPEVEEVLSEYLFEKGRSQRSFMLSPMMVRVEDLARVLSLPPETVAEFSTAAKGAVEASLDTWKSSMERYARTAVGAATRQNVKKMLEGRRNSYSTSGMAPESHERWTSALDRLLTDAQREAWQREIDAREVYFQKAIASVAMMALDKKRKLTQEQWDKFKPLIEDVIAVYHEDINRHFSRAWYLQSYYSALPLAGIPEEAATEILSPAQWKACREQDLPDVQSYWDNIVKQHEQRLKTGNKGDVDVRRRIVLPQ